MNESRMKELAGINEGVEKGSIAILASLFTSFLTGGSREKKIALDGLAKYGYRNDFLVVPTDPKEYSNFVAETHRAVEKLLRSL